MFYTIYLNLSNLKIEIIDICYRDMKPENLLVAVSAGLSDTLRGPVLPRIRSNFLEERNDLS